jgi:hypothetical protein
MKVKKSFLFPQYKKQKQIMKKESSLPLYRHLEKRDQRKTQTTRHGKTWMTRTPKTQQRKEIRNNT